MSSFKSIVKYYYYDLFIKMLNRNEVFQVKGRNGTRKGLEPREHTLNFLTFLLLFCLPKGWAGVII
jgi:hypothetical protein